MKPLPIRAYEYAEWMKATVNVDYHIAVDGHYYSVPHQLIKELVDVRLTANTIEVQYKNNRMDRQPRADLRQMEAYNLNGTYAQEPPEILEWTPARIIAWASKNGLHTLPGLSKAGVIRNWGFAPVWGS
jgi:hypothetical protein